MPKKGVVLGDAVELPLKGKDAGPLIPLTDRGAGITFGDGGDVGGADKLDVVAIVVFEDGQGVAALLGQGDGAPLLESRAGDGLAVAVLGIVGVDSACLADISAEDLVGELDHHVKHGAAVDVILIVAGGIGDVDGITPAGIPFGVDAVERQRDLAVDVGPQGLLGPGNTE